MSSLILGSCLILLSTCGKPEPVETPFNLRNQLAGRLWFAELITQGGLDVTAAHNYSLQLRDSVNCIMQRKWQGVNTQFVCKYTIDEDNDAIQVKHDGSPDNTWEIEWQLLEADTVYMRFRFRDAKASSDTFINLRTF